MSGIQSGPGVRAAGLAIALVCLAAGPAPGRAELRAERVDETNAAELLLEGPDAIGGIGDWALANDVVSVIVDDPGRAHGKLNHGGTLIDAALRTGGDDQFARLFPIVNLDQRVLIGFDRIRAELDPGGAWARLVVSNSDGMRSVARGPAWRRRLDPLVPDSEALRDVFVETEYLVRPGEPFVHITTTLENRGDAPAPVFSYGDVWMRGGRSLRSFVGNTLDPELSEGFQHVGFDRRNLLDTAPMNALTFVAMPGMPSFAPVAYAIAAPERAQRGLPLYGVTGEHVNLLVAFVGDPPWRELGLLRIARALFRELAPGESWLIRRRLVVSDHADVASLTDSIFPLLGVADGRSGVRGRVEPGGVRVAIEVRDAATGVAVTEIAPLLAGPEAGRYTAVLPPGRYLLSLRAAQRPERSIEVEVEDGAFQEVPVQRFEEPGWLAFGRGFADGGAGRVVVQGIEGTPDPVFEPELLGFLLDGRPAQSGSEIGSLYFIGNRHDPTRVALAPGRYRLTASRGFEWDVASLELEIPEAGAEAQVPPFDLRRVIALPGVLSADLHVHAEASDDSGISNETRLRSYVAESVDVMVSTDHDHVARFEPALWSLDLQQRIRVVIGVEVTGSAPNDEAMWTIGHHNAWPIARGAQAHRHGAPPSQNRSVAQLYSELREDYGAQVVQLNHPRDSVSGEVEEGAFFTHLGSVGEAFRPDLPLDALPNRALLETADDGETRALDFDAVELANGSSRAQYLAVREDWHSLLRQGVRRTATANSDSHAPAQIAAYPRNYLDLRSYPSGGPAAFDAAVREGRLFGTTGPLLAAFTVNGGRMGDLVPAEDGRIVVSLEVAAAPWVPVEEVRLLVNGSVVRRFSDLSGATTAAGIRFGSEVALAVNSDAFVTVEAGAALDADADSWAARNPGPYADALAPGFVPMLFSNPVYVDHDGNGRFDAPGLGDSPGGSGAVLSGSLALGATVSFVTFLALRRGRRARRSAG